MHFRLCRFLSQLKKKIYNCVGVKMNIIQVEFYSVFLLILKGIKVLCYLCLLEKSALYIYIKVFEKKKS